MEETGRNHAAQPCVLVADPDHSVRDFVKSALEEIGLIVREAGNATEVRKWLRHETIDLVLAEVMLPHTCGDKLVPEMNRRHIPVALMSGNPGALRRAQAVSQLVLRKPLQIKDVLRVAIVGLPSWRHPARSAQAQPTN